MANVVFDEILGKVRAGDVSGGTSGGDYIGGFGISIEGQTVNRVRYMPIETVSGSSVTLMAGHAYKVYATSQAITLNTETIPANSFGLEGHIEIFVSGTGYVVTGLNVVLANALEPDAVNNCTVRFHDGLAIISVEDHVAGYIVVSATGSTAGTLPYALSSATQDYVAFDASLNGATLDLGGAVTNGEKHVVGNGRNDTFISGTVTGTSQTTFANLTFSGSVIADGATEFADGIYHIDTVTGSDRLTIGRGAIIDLTGNTNPTPIDPGSGVTFAPGGAMVYPSAGSASAYVLGGMTVPSIGNTNVLNSAGTFIMSGGIASNFLAQGAVFQSSSIRGVYVTGATGSFSNCVISGNSNATGAGIYCLGGYAKVMLKDTIVSGNLGTYGTLGYTVDALAQNGATITFGGGCTVGNVAVAGASISFAGTNGVDNVATVLSSGFVTISSGASISLTSSINPGGSGGIQVVGGTCTVNGNVIESGTYTSIDNNGSATV